MFCWVFLHSKINTISKHTAESPDKPLTPLHLFPGKEKQFSIHMCVIPRMKRNVTHTICKIVYDIAMWCEEENEMIKLCGKICKFLYFHMIYSVQNATRHTHSERTGELTSQPHRQKRRTAESDTLLQFLIKTFGVSTSWKSKWKKFLRNRHITKSNFCTVFLSFPEISFKLWAPATQRCRRYGHNAIQATTNSLW